MDDNLRPGPDADLVSIARTREAMFDAFNAANVDGFVALVADDAVWMSHAGPPPTMGKGAIRSDYKAFFERGPFVPRLAHTSDEVVVSGDWAFDRGTWDIVRTYQRGGRRERLRSNYVIIWRRDRAGTWKVAWFIWNGAPTPIEARARPVLPKKRVRTSRRR